MQFWILLGCLAIVIGGCSSTANRTDSESSSALQRIIAGDHRSQANRARYAGIGESDRFTLKFRKVATR